MKTEYNTHAMEASTQQTQLTWPHPEWPWKAEYLKRREASLKRGLTEEQMRELEAEFSKNLLIAALTEDWKDFEELKADCELGATFGF